jgi:hypothetical protein
MNTIGIATIIAIPIYLAMWGLVAILTIRYKRKLKIEYPSEYMSRSGIRYLGGFLRRREYREFGSDEFILESELLRILTKIWWFVFFTTIALLIIFLTTHGRSYPDDTDNPFNSLEIR